MQSIKESLALADLSSRGKRRKAITLVIGLLERIRTEEQCFIVKMPLNLQGSDAYETAEYSIDMLDEAIDVVSSVYDD